MKFQLFSSAPGSTTVTVFPRQQHKRMSEAGIISRKGKRLPWKEVIHFPLDVPFALQAQYEPSIGRA